MADIEQNTKEDKTKKDRENEEKKAAAKKEDTVTTNLSQGKIETQDMNKNTQGVSNESEDSTAENKLDNKELLKENEKADLLQQNTNALETKVKKIEGKEAKKENKQGNKPRAKTDKKAEEAVDENKPVEIKLVQTHYKTHAKSNLPHVLTEYGLEDKDHPTILKEKQKKKQKKKKVEHSSYDTDDEERARRKAREQKFRQDFGDARQADTYYMEYIEFLEEKVIKQRQKAQKEKEEAERLRALREEEEKHKRHFVRRLQRVELKHDDSFLKDLPKTDVARIIVLQDKLKKDGKLKTQHDVDKFWNDIKKPEVFYEHFKVKKKDAGVTELESDNVFISPKGDRSESPEMAPRSLSHISETSRDRDPWAITQKYQSIQGPKTPSSERSKRKDSTQTARDAALDLEKRCPKLEMPPLACFSLKLGEKPPDPEETMRKFELKAREKTRKKFQRKLNKMYQMAMTNTAAANRILNQHGDITNILEGAALRDVIAVFDEPYPTMDDYYRDILDPSRAMEVHQEADRVSRESRSQPSTRQSSAASRRLTPIIDTASRSSSKSSKKKKSPAMIEYPTPLPLSFNEVITKEKTMEAKCTSTLWTNYMHAGKSVFAQT